MSRDVNPSATPANPTAARLLGAAAAMFRAKGYAGTSTRELAAFIGLRNASLYHHIGRKEDLLYALCVDALSRMHAEVEAAVSREEAPIDALWAMIRTHVAIALEDQDKHATMLFELRALSDARRAEVIALRDRYEVLMQRTIAGAQRVGAIRSDISARHLTFGLLNLLNWSIFWFRPGGELTPRELAELLGTIYLSGATSDHVGLREPLDRDGSGDSITRVE